MTDEVREREDWQTPTTPPFTTPTESHPADFHGEPKPFQSEGKWGRPTPCPRGDWNEGIGLREEPPSLGPEKFP